MAVLPGQRPLSASATPLRLKLKYASVVAMYSCLGLLLIALFTYKTIPRIDRRPPLILGEFVGVGAFIIYALGTMPVLAPPAERASADHHHVI